MRAERILLALSVAVLAACGGGGGGGGGGSPSSSATTTGGAGTASSGQSVSGVLVTSVPNPTYAANSDVLATYNGVGTIRTQAGVGALAQASALDKAAASHATYLSLAGFSGDHSETPGTQGFTGATPTARAAAAGYTGSKIGESIVFGASSGAQCAAALENSVYHLVEIISPFIDVGLAYLNQGNNASVCVLDYGIATGQFGQFPPSGTLAVYPAAGLTGIPPVFYNTGETPNPALDLTTAGHPVAVSLYSLGNTSAGATLAPADVVVSAFTIAVSGGAAVPVRVIVSPGVTVTSGTSVADGNLAGAGFVVALPTLPLMAATSYTAHFAGMAKGVSLDRTWSFTTGPAN